MSVATRIEIGPTLWELIERDIWLRVSTQTEADDRIKYRIVQLVASPISFGVGEHVTGGVNGAESD